ncbi:heparinase II/III family protein [Pedobacter heparinus]|uniref:heparinase II/III domain-containing protein n=1 Tax=Pedobacter heparinus TaxID=984 RepID=UPI00292F8B11|nr:heparinase II/III family protein [Pedobacter heparinus]
MKIIKLSCLHAIIFLICAFHAAAQSAADRDPALKSAGEFEKILRVKVPQGPFLYINQQELTAVRNRVEKEEWARSVKDSYVKTADAWIKRDYEFVKQVIPVKGSIYVYGLGLNLDPVEQKRMTWRGWNDPRHVEASNGIVYPNGEHLDEGMGWNDPKNKSRYYFIALANGMTIAKLESTELPALVNAYALTQNETYAERALWILDAIATIYPRAYEGPIDYPHNEPGKPDGGRLDRPYYQAARALMNYAYFTEILSASKHAAKPSMSNPGYTMLKNIELNMLMNGADYCLRMAKSGKGASYELNNGNIDYNRAPLVVGALLGIPEWVNWALNGPLGFKNAVSNTIDINGRYFETGTLYASHTRELLLSTAYFLKRMQLPSYPKGYAAYDDPRFALFAFDFFTGIQVAGRLPLYGDAGPDDALITSGRAFDKGTLKAAYQFYRYTDNNALRDAALKTGRLMLQNAPPGGPHSGADLFDLYGWEEFTKAAQHKAPSSASERRSTLFFDSGTLVLRSGQHENERAALLRFGPTLNHGQADELGLAFYAKGREFSFDPGYFNTHLRFGFTTTTVAHNLLVVNRRNQLRQPSAGGDLQTWTDGSVLRSAAVNDLPAYADQNLKLYKRRIALIDLSDDDSYLIDNFWAKGGQEYDYSLHGISKGKLQVLNTSQTVLKQTRAGSVWSPDVDYAAEMDPNGRVKSYADKPFYFAPPGEGYGFLSGPAFYTLNGPVNLQWSATDTTGHQLYVSHFAPPSAQLITAHSPQPRNPIHLSYALSHVKVPVSELVRFSSVILPTSGKNKLATVRQLMPLNGIKNAFALQLTPTAEVKSSIRQHFYIAADKVRTSLSFDTNLSFSGEEGYLGIDAAGKVLAASLTGAGHISNGNFKMTVQPLFTAPLKILQVKSRPLRIKVNAPYASTGNLAGSIIRVNRVALARPYALRVNAAKADGRNSWLMLDASSNVHAVGKVKRYDPKTHGVVTDAPFPHTRPYTYNYSYETGLPAISTANRDYNGGYNGFWLVDSQSRKKAMIRNMTNKRTHILLDSKSSTFKPGDQFEIRLLAPGDSVEVSTWGQAKRNETGTWKTQGAAIIKLIEK